jgi:hypothetical protein
VKEVTPCEKQKLCSKTFAQEVLFILHYSPVEEKNEILNLQTMDPPLRLSRRACHVLILKRLRMERNRCDNSYYSAVVIGGRKLLINVVSSNN